MIAARSMANGCGNEDDEMPAGAGSIIIVVAIDAPLLPHQLKRIAKRTTLGLARVGE